MNFQQSLQRRVSRHAQANCQPLGMREAARDFFGCFKDEGEGARRAGFEQAKLCVVDPCIAGELFEIAAK